MSSGRLFVGAAAVFLPVVAALWVTSAVSAHSHYFYAMRPIVIGRDDQSTVAIVKRFPVGEPVTLSHSGCPDGVALEYEPTVVAVANEGDSANAGWAIWDITASVAGNSMPGTCTLVASDGSYSASRDLSVIPSSEEGRLRIEGVAILWLDGLTVQWEPDVPPGLWRYIPSDGAPGSVALSRYVARSYVEGGDGVSYGVRAAWFYSESLGRVIPRSLYVATASVQPGVRYCAVVRVDLPDGSAGPWSEEVCRTSPGDESVSDSDDVVENGVADAAFRPDPPAARAIALGLFR